MHALGFSKFSLGYFRKPDGTEYSTGTETCGGYNGVKSVGTDVLKIIPNSDLGYNMPTIVTPKVKQVARNHFGCNTLEGALIENQPTTVNACFGGIGSHWEERVFNNDTMSPISSKKAYMHYVTLA